MLFARQKVVSKDRNLSEFAKIPPSPPTNQQNTQSTNNHSPPIQQPETRLQHNHSSQGMERLFFCRHALFELTDDFVRGTV